MPSPLATSLQAVKDRLADTIGVAQEIADTWTWDMETPAQLQERGRQLDAQPPAQNQTPALGYLDAQAEEQEQTSRAALDGALKNLHQQTLAVVSGLSARARLDATLAVSLEDLSARGNSRAEILDEAAEALVAWEDHDDAWTPLNGLTLASFRSLRESIVRTDVNGLNANHRKARAKARRAAAAVMTYAAKTEDVLMAWYEAATGAFPAGTTIGDLIRSRIRTSYTGEVEAPAPATGLVAQGAGAGRLVVDCDDSARATGWRWEFKGAADADFTPRATTSVSEALLSGLPTGAGQLRVVAFNSGGDAEPIAVVAVTVG